MRFDKTRPDSSDHAGGSEENAETYKPTPQQLKFVEVINSLGYQFARSLHPMGCFITQNGIAVSPLFIFHPTSLHGLNRALMQCVATAMVLESAKLVALEMLENTMREVMQESPTPPPFSSGGMPTNLAEDDQVEWPEEVGG